MTGHTRSRTSRRRVAGLAGLALALPLLASGVASASTPGPRAPSPLAAAGPLVHVGTTPAVPGGARQLGALAGGSEITGGIVLAPRDPAALTAAATAVSDPSSPDYGQYLGQGQFAKRFGPAPAVLTAVETLLHAGGLRVTGVSEDHLLVSFAGSAADSEATFHTQIERWRLASGRLGTETSGAPSLPAGIAKDVTAVIGLDDLVVPHSMLEPADLHGGAAHRDAPTRTTTPAPVPAPGAHKTTSTSVPPPGPVACPAAVTDAQGLDGITDQQLAAGYGVDGLYGAGDFGAGQTVDIYELEPFAMSDIAAFDECYFGASHTSQVTVIPVEGGQPAGAGSGEALLDVEDVSAIAPAARIDVYEAPLTTSGTLDDYIAIVDQDRAHVVSTSWGLCESGAQLGDPGLQQAENEVFEQAAVQGQSVFGPAGDDGSDDCSAGTTPAKPYLSVDDPASQPFVVAVGGTTIYSTPPDSAPGEAVWNDGPGGGGSGGGISNTWAMPAWQRDSTVPGVLNKYSTSKGHAYEACRAPASAGGAGMSAATLCRELPDVTALADEGTGITVYAAEYGGWTTFGGTSSSTPLWAAMTADINASTTCATTPGIAHDLGFVSPALYQVAANPVSRAEAFNDITKGNNDTLGANHGLFPATPGFDLASGLGSPRITNPANGSTGLAALLCAAATGTRPAVTGLAPLDGTTAGGTRVTITGKGFEQGGHKDVEAVMFGSHTGTRLTVLSATKLTVTAPAASVPPTDGAPRVLGQGVYVAVLLRDGAANSPSLGDVYRYVTFTDGAVSPAVSYVGPSGGPRAGGTLVTILGSGFAAGSAPQVHFGGVASPSVKVLDDHTIVARTPADTGTTRCAAADAHLPICQVEVTVTIGRSTSAVTTILPPLEGAASFDSQGVIPPQPGTETVTSPTEFDYAPSPAITSISPSPGSEQGGNIVIHGTGFDLLTFQWVNEGPPSQSTSQDNQITSITPTEIDIAGLAPDTTSVPVSVQSLGGLSNTFSYHLAPVPSVTHLSAHVGLTTGAQRLEITGHGLADADQVRFVSRFQPQFNLPATQDVLDHVSATELVISTPSDFPVPTDVLVCSNSGCSSPDPAVDLFTYAYPGRAVVTGSTPASGGAAGGTLVKITGSDLSAATAVWFGSVKSTDFYNPPGEFSGGKNNVVFAESPPASPGTVSITVQTLGGTASGEPPSAPTPHATFTYIGGD